MSNAFYIGYIGLWALVIFQTFVLLGVLRELSQARRTSSPQSADGEASQLPYGTRAPDFAAEELWSGRKIRRKDLLGRKQSILLFLTPACKTCEHLAAEVHGIQHKAEGNLFAVCHGEKEGCLRFLERHGVRIPVLLDPHGEITSRFKVHGTPMALMLDGEARIRSYGTPRRAEDVQKIIEEAKLAREQALEAAPAKAQAG